MADPRLSGLFDLPQEPVDPYLLSRVPLAPGVYSRNAPPQLPPQLPGGLSVSANAGYAWDPSRFGRMPLNRSMMGGGFPGAYVPISPVAGALPGPLPDQNPWAQMLGQGVPIPSTQDIGTALSIRKTVPF